MTRQDPIIKSLKMDTESLTDIEENLDSYGKSRF